MPTYAYIIYGVYVYVHVGCILLQAINRRSFHAFKSLVKCLSMNVCARVCADVVAVVWNDSAINKRWKSQLYTANYTHSHTHFCIRVSATMHTQRVCVCVLLLPQSATAATCCNVVVAISCM